MSRSAYSGSGSGPGGRPGRVGLADGVRPPGKLQPECEVVARMLRLGRLAKRWTLTELADRAGLTRQTVRRVEQSRQVPTLDVLVRLVWAMGGEFLALIRAVESLAAQAPAQEPQLVNGRMSPETGRQPAA